MAKAVELVSAERARQIEAEAFTPEHDSGYHQAELSRAAACYALPRGYRRFDDDGKPVAWPWPLAWWKPAPWKSTRADRLRELAKAGALILAEIERMQGKAGADDDRSL